MTARRFAIPLLGLALAAAPAGAAVFTVTTTVDTLDGACDAHCSLREAIAAANAAPTDDEVRLGPGTYLLDVPPATPPEDAGVSGDLDVADDLRLIGAGAAVTIIDGAGASRVLHVLPLVHLELSDVTIRNGRAGSQESLGGGLFVHGGEAVVRRAVFLLNTAAEGGGAYDMGKLVVEDSSFVSNQADIGGAILGGDLHLTNVTFSANQAEDGAALRAVGRAKVLQSTFVGNGDRLDDAIVEESFPITLPPPSQVELTGSVIALEVGPVTPGDETHIIDGNLLGRRLGLGPLAANGGPTPTHPPLAGSPAIDAGSAAPGNACAPTDQHGRPRPADGNGDGLARCDLGAVESGDPCGEDGLCLGGERFRVTARFATPQGGEGTAHPLPLTGDTGAFWFFDPANVELVVKVLDACVPFDRFWVFATGLTNVEVEITVEDTRTGAVKTYTNPQGRPFPPILDTDAFAACP